MTHIDQQQTIGNLAVRVLLRALIIRLNLALCCDIWPDILCSVAHWLAFCDGSKSGQINIKWPTKHWCKFYFILEVEASATAFGLCILQGLKMFSYATSKGEKCKIHYNIVRLKYFSPSKVLLLK